MCIAEKYTIARTEAPCRPSTVQRSSATREPWNLRTLEPFFSMEPPAMRLHHLIRRARIGTIAALFTAISVSVFAQNGQSQFSISLQQASAQAAAQLQTGSVRRISIDEAVTLAMEQNLGIRIQRFDPQIQDTSVAQARAFWAPNFTTNFNRNSQTLQSTNAFTGSGASTLNQSFLNQVVFNQTLRTGAQYSATWFNSRTTTTNLSEIFVPRLGSGLNLQFSQPLMRNFQIDQIRQQVANSKKSRELSDIQLGGVITGTLRAVKNAYWDLSYAIANLKTQQQSLALAQQSLKDNQKRVEIGTMAPIDIVQAQAEVASN